MVWMSKTHLPLTVKDNLRKGLLKLLIPTFLEQQPLFYQPHPFYGKILTPFLGKLWKLNLLHLQKGWGPTIDMMWVKVNNNSAFVVVVVVVVVSEQLFVSRKEMLNVWASFCWNKIFNCPEVWLLKSVSEQQTFLNTADLLQPSCFCCSFPSIHRNFWFYGYYTAQKMKFSIKDFFSKCEKEIRRFIGQMISA